MISNKKNIPVLALTVASLLVGTAYARETKDSRVNQALNYYCAQKEVSTEENVVIGESRQVNLQSGSLYLVESDSAYQATMDLVSQEVVSMGVSSECAEYLFSRSSLKGYKQGNVLARVFFDFDKYNLSKDSRYILQSIADKLKLKPSDLTLEGHTDNIGTRAYNFTLGLKRSEAVKAYLVQKGVHEDNLVSLSKGENRPVASNKTADGRRQNRRVDMISE